MQPHFSLLGCWKFKPRVNLAGTRLNHPPFLAATTAQPRVLRAILFMALLSRALLPLLSRERPLPSSCDSRQLREKLRVFWGCLGERICAEISRVFCSNFHKELRQLV
jgi:hypothetical protein